MPQKIALDSIFYEGVLTNLAEAIVRFNLENISTLVDEALSRE